MVVIFLTALMKAHEPVVIISDKRLKEGISQLDSKEAWQQVLALRGVNYHMKDKKNKGLETSSGTSIGIGSDTHLHIGFIAQEVAAVVPEVVSQVRICMLWCGGHHFAFIFFLIPIQI